MKDSKLKTAGMRKLHWGKAVMSIVVTLAAMPLTHSLARVLKEGTTGVEQFYAGMGMGAFGLFMVIAGVFVKGHIRQTLLGLFGGMFYWMGAVDFLFMYFANRFGTQAQLDPVTGVSVTACYLRFLGYGDDTLSVLYPERMQLLELVAEIIFRQAQKGDCCPGHDAPHKYCSFYGSDHYAMDVLPGTDVLL